MSESPTSQAEVNFVCECESWCRSACVAEGFYGEHEGKRYCVLHYPDENKIIAFEKSYKQKLDNQDYDFEGVVFPIPLNFESFTFKSRVDFSSAKFLKDVRFEFCRFNERARFFGSVFERQAGFISLTFEKNAEFSSARFLGSTFFPDVVFEDEADFSYAKFSKESSFGSVTFFGNADFRSTVFADFVDFANAFFGNYVRFSINTHFANGEDMSFDFQFTRIEKPERVSFHSLQLRPHWFVNTDPREFTFVDVTWPLCDAQTEIDGLRTKKGFWQVSSPHPLLAIAARQLADNAEANHRYDDASNLRYLAMEARRLESWRGFAFWRLSWWYWLASGYGERILRAFLVLLGIWLAAAMLYTQVGFARWEPRLASEADVALGKKDEVGAPLRFSRALTYSGGVLTLQRPEPKPATAAAHTLVLLETILGPVQAALLALAIRRKFMR